MSQSTCFYDAYDQVELRLPNRLALVCRALTVGEAARCLHLLERQQYDALWNVLRRLILPPARRDRRNTRRTLAKLRNLEITTVINRFLVIEDTTAPTPAKANGQKDTAPRSYDDLLAEYAAVFGGPPAPNLPWPTFLACVRRADRFAARELLRVMTGTSYGAATVFASEKTRASLTSTMRRVQDLAQ